MILPAKYLLAPFKTLGVITNAPKTFMRHNTELLLKFSDALQTKERHNTIPISYIIKSHSMYDHKREMESIASTINIVSNRYPFKLVLNGRNMNEPLDALFIWGWINGCSPQIESVFMLEYINPPIKCSATTDYVERVNSLDIRKYN